MAKKEKKPAEQIPEKEKKQPITTYFEKERVMTENSDEAKELYNHSRFGILLDDGRVQLSLIEALYLLEKGKIQVFSGKKTISFDDFLKKARRNDAKFYTRYTIFKDIRNRGYIVKTALKFGADFRVYDRGVKPGEDHARWVVYPVHENETLTWHEFSAKNRVAHSTKKRLLVGCLDQENDITYWEIRWIRP